MLISLMTKEITTIVIMYSLFSLENIINPHLKDIQYPLFLTQLTMLFTFLTEFIHLSHLLLLTILFFLFPK